MPQRTDGLVTDALCLRIAHLGKVQRFKQTSSALMPVRERSQHAHGAPLGWHA